MDAYAAVLAGSPLFAGSSGAQINEMLRCLSAREHEYPAGAMIFSAGEEAYALGILLEGSVDVVQEDFWGNRGMLARIAPGELFAESFAVAQTPRLPVSVVAHRASLVLLLDYRRVVQTCTNACPHHARMIENLLETTARKNVYLTQKLEILSKRTIRERVLTYLAMEAQRTGSRSFTIAYDRQALADYLAVDRSALSRTLSEMRREGLFTFSKSAFVLRELEGETPS